MSQHKYKKTKIVCTIGPSTWDPEMLEKIAHAGMNVARLNFSHGAPEEKGAQIKDLRAISKKISKPIAILADMPGPKLRLGKFEGIREIKKGDTVQFSLNPVADELPMQFDLSPYVKKGQRVFLNDGLVELLVQSISGKTVKGIAQNDGWVSSNKGVNVPDTLIEGAAFTERDEAAATFALNAGVDYLAISFVQTADDLVQPRKLIEKLGSHAKIVVKVESAQAISNLEEIVKQTDAIMVARGDLGIEIPASEVPLIQHKLIRLCRRYQKPVIVATQMLESMTENPRPTRAEASDVARAVMDQVDAVMLSAETASGKYPVEAVTVMKDIIRSVESDREYHHHIKVDWEFVKTDDISYNAVVSAAATVADQIKAKAILLPTATGRMARLLTSHRPDAQIVAVAHDEKIGNQLALMWGVRSVIAKPAGNFDAFLKKAIEVVKSNGFADSGDRVVIATGSTVGLSGSTDTIKIISIP